MTQCSVCVRWSHGDRCVYVAPLVVPPLGVSARRACGPLASRRALPGHVAPGRALSGEGRLGGGGIPRVIAPGRESRERALTPVFSVVAVRRDGLWTSVGVVATWPGDSETCPKGQGSRRPRGQGVAAVRRVFAPPARPWQRLVCMCVACRALECTAKRGNIFSNHGIGYQRTLIVYSEGLPTLD